MTHLLTRLKITTAACLTGLLAAAPVQATDWLMIQGTEPDGAAERARVWGFIQPQYNDIGDTKLKAGPWAGQDAVFNVIAPGLDTNSGFQLRRARLGVRGTGFPLDSNVNYFLLAEFGDNGITANSDGGRAGDRCQYHAQSPERVHAPALRPVQDARFRGRSAGHPRAQLQQLLHRGRPAAAGTLPRLGRRRHLQCPGSHPAAVTDGVSCGTWPVPGAMA